MNRRPLTRRPAFTLIELLVVITIVALLTSITAAAFNNFSRRQRLTQAAKKMDEILRDAQTRALSSVDGLNWGVHLEKDQGNSSIFSTGSDFANASQVLDRSLESEITVSDLTITENDHVNIIFTVLNGSVVFSADDGSCLGGSADSSCGADPDRCLAIGINLQGTADKRYLKVNERNIFETDALIPCP
jgi:prepilin-type N-terminal cleavage/methylation domain-containing protein